MSRKNTVPVQIIRKDKRINHKLTHLVAFGLTGGLSGAVTAAEAANHARYNARTRQLQAEYEQADVPVRPALSRAEQLELDEARRSYSPRAEKAARKAISDGTPREYLSPAEQLAYDRLTS